MTYQEAIEEKKKYNNTIEKDSITYRILVVPKNKPDLDKYLNDFPTLKKVDESAKYYSRNGEYAVLGVSTDGANVFHNEPSQLQKKSDL